MDLIKEIVQNILIIMLLNILLEMLMPRSNMGRYIKLVMGLFIIVAVLNPVLSFLNKDLSIMTLTLPREDRGETQGLIDKGRALGQEKRQEAVKEFENKVAQQVLALARLDGKAKVQRVVVEAEEDPQNAGYGTLKEIVVFLGEQDSTLEEKEAMRVNPVEIDVKSSQQENQPIKDEGATIHVGELKAILADFYGIDPGKITIVNK